MSFLERPDLDDLYMTATEQYEALELAGFREIKVVLEKKDLILFRAAA